MPNNGMKNYIYRIINSTKLKNPLYYGHAPNLNSILNKLSVSKNCSKSKSFINLTVEMSNKKATLRFLIGLLWVVIQSS